MQRLDQSINQSHPEENFLSTFLPASQQIALNLLFVVLRVLIKPLIFGLNTPRGR